MAACVMSAPAALVFAKLMCRRRRCHARRTPWGRRGVPGRQRDRRRGARGRGGAPPGAERRGHAAGVHRAHRAAERLCSGCRRPGGPRPVPSRGGLARGKPDPHAGGPPGLAPGTAGLGHGRAVGRRRGGGLPDGHQDGGERVRRATSSSPGCWTSGADLAPRSVIIATYALCGFANFSSIAIQIGGIGGIAPSRRSDLARLGLRAMVGGTLAAFMTATVAGLLV